jgi:hypothetical protein
MQSVGMRGFQWNFIQGIPMLSMERLLGLQSTAAEPMQLAAITGQFLTIAIEVIMKQLAMVIGLVFLTTTFYAEAGNRKGSKRVGGYNSHGKGSHYIGGRK